MPERPDRALVPFCARLMGMLARALPPQGRRMLSRSRIGRAAHRFVQQRSGVRQWVTVEAGLNKGARLLLDLRCGEYVNAWGLHEPEVQRLLPSVVRPGQVVYDLGANIGLISVALARLVGPSGRVYAFEPVCPEVIEAVANENALSQIVVVRQAVADWVGEGVMLEAIDVLSAAQGAAGTAVPVTTIDTWVFDDGFPPPSFIKIDIEGAEGAALAGMGRVAARYKPALLIEIHGAKGDRPSQAEPVWNWLAAHGYDILHYAGGTWCRATGPFEGRCLATAGTARPMGGELD